MISERHAYIYIQLAGTLQTVPAALLKVQKLPDGNCIGRFRYGNHYLAREDAIALDPFHLPLGNKIYEFTRLKGIPGAVRDAGPDAWGRRAIEYDLERSAADLEEIDYLLYGPQDGAGNLSFGLKPTPPAAPRRYNRAHRLVELIDAVEAIEEGKRVPRDVFEQLEAATSMGGARPKATIEHENRLWIAKFPEKADRFSLQSVEYATLELARRCDLDVCNARVQRVDGKYVLMLERFDRVYTYAGYLRLGLVSGLTLLDSDDSHADRERWSYPLLADNLRRWTQEPVRDCVELFRRMVFNAAITNNDDHPRNHAILNTDRGWRLSPAYDLVPSPVVSLERRDLALAVGKFGRTASVYNLVSQCTRFGMSVEAANAEIERIASVVRGWREVFVSCGVSAQDIEYIAPAFLPECFFFKQPPQAL